MSLRNHPRFAEVEDVGGLEREDVNRQDAEPQQTIARQAVEIKQLRALLADRGFADELRELLLATGVAARVAAPATHGEALERVVETAASVLDAQAASLFLVDEESEELVFQVALGQKAAEVRHFRLPLGRGLAGYVAATGQPLAVANVEQDPRFARDIGQAIDYIPRTLLCVPLFLGNRVVGVLELLDKAKGMSFTVRDIGVLARFADLAALTIDQSRFIQDLHLLFRALLTDALPANGSKPQAARFADRAAESADNSEALRLAGLVADLSRSSDAASRLTLEVLTAWPDT